MLLQTEQCPQLVVRSASQNPGQSTPAEEIVTNSLPFTSRGLPMHKQFSGHWAITDCLWSLLPAPQGRTEHFSARQEIQFYLPTLFNLDNSTQSQRQQQQGTDYRSAKWLMLNLNKPENANPFRSRIVVMDSGVLKSVTTLGISVKQAFSAAFGRWS